MAKLPPTPINMPEHDGLWQNSVPLATVMAAQVERGPCMRLWALASWRQCTAVSSATAMGCRMQPASTPACLVACQKVAEEGPAEEVNLLPQRFWRIFWG